MIPRRKTTRQNVRNLKLFSFQHAPQQYSTNISTNTVRKSHKRKSKSSQDSLVHIFIQKDLKFREFFTAAIHTGYHVVLRDYVWSLVVRRDFLRESDQNLRSDHQIGDDTQNIESDKFYKRYSSESGGFEVGSEDLEAGRCPFTGKSTSVEQKQCPFSRFRDKVSDVFASARNRNRRPQYLTMTAGKGISASVDANKRIRPATVSGPSSSSNNTKRRDKAKKVSVSYAEPISSGGVREESTIAPDTPTQTDEPSSTFDSKQNRHESGDERVPALLTMDMAHKFYDSDDFIKLWRGILCFLCVISGAVLPWMVELSKTATLRQTDFTISKPNQGEGLRGDLMSDVPVTTSIIESTRNVFPFAVMTVLLTECFTSLSIAFFFLLRRENWCPYHAVMKCVDPALCRRLIPFAMIYVGGDVATMYALDNASGVVYVVIGQLKILVTAVLTRIVFGPSRALTFSQWSCLFGMVTAAAWFATLKDPGQAPIRAVGLFWSFFKCLISGAVAVFAEKNYKKADVCVSTTIVKTYCILFMTAFLIVQPSAAAVPPLCSSDAYLQCMAMAQPGTSCHCIDSGGWDRWTFTSVVAHVFAWWLNVFVFKHLSAVVKYVCRALTAPTIYVWYCLMSRASFDLRIVCLLLMVVNILAYKQFGDQHAEYLAKKKVDDLETGTKFGKGISVRVQPYSHKKAQVLDRRPRYDTDAAEFKTPILGPSSPRHVASPAG